MKLEKKNIFLLIIFVVLIGVSVFLLYFYNKDDEYIYESGEDLSLKHYKENEYIPVNISYDRMARIYLQDYVYKLLYDREASYNSLNREYREKKFKSFEHFNEYVDSYIYGKKMMEMKVEKFSITDRSTYRDFDVYDSADNLFIFRETGVMQYTVFFDRFTLVDM